MIGFFFLFGLIKGLKILEEEVEIGFFLFLSILVLKGLDDEDDEEDELEEVCIVIKLIKFRMYVWMKMLKNLFYFLRIKFSEGNIKFL